MNVVVVGLGSMGKRRIRLLKRFAVVDRIIGVDSKLERRQETEKDYECTTYISVEEAIQAEENIECGFVCTSPLSHNDIISELLSHNLHVFTELNLVPDGYEKNIRLSKELRRVLFLSSTFLYRAEIRYLRERLKGVSDLNYVYHVGQYLPDWHPWENFNDFFIGDRRTNGCREIMAIELPWITGIFGKIERYSVMSDKMTKLNIDYKDNYLLLVEHGNRIRGAFIIDVVSPKAVRNLEIYGEGIYYCWDGTPKGLKGYDNTAKAVKNIELYDDIDQIEGYRDYVVENAYEHEIKAFFDTIGSDYIPEYSFEDDKKILMFIDEIEG